MIKTICDPTGTCMTLSELTMILISVFNNSSRSTGTADDGGTVKEFQQVSVRAGSKSPGSIKDNDSKVRRGRYLSQSYGTARGKHIPASC